MLLEIIFLCDIFPLYISLYITVTPLSTKNTNCLSSIYPLSYLPDVTKRGQSLGKSYSHLWSKRLIFTHAFREIGLSILCFCVPTEMLDFAYNAFCIDGFLRNISVWVLLLAVPKSFKKYICILSLKYHQTENLTIFLGFSQGEI